MTTAQNSSAQRILCIRLSGLGDVVHALNALSLLRRERPDAHIAWAVEDRFSGLLHGHPCLDELIPVPNARWRPWLRNPLRWPRLWVEHRRAGRGLRETAFDASVDFQSGLKSTWIVRRAGAPVRAGFGRGVSRELNWLVQNRRVPVPTQGVHRIERDLALLAPLGIKGAYADPVLPVARPEAQAAEGALAGLLGGGPLAVIHPGASASAAFKRWDPARYARVADGLVRERGADVLVTHGPEELRLAQQVTASMEERGLLAPPTPTLQQLTYLLSRAALFIGSDTGPMHMASALGVPAVALFGPKDPVQTGPYCSRAVVVTGTADCRPCGRRRCSHVRCMTTITADRVLAAALAVLDGGGECRAPAGRPPAGGDGAPRVHLYDPQEWDDRVTICYDAGESGRG